MWRCEGVARSGRATLRAAGVALLAALVAWAPGADAQQAPAPPAAPQSLAESLAQLDKREFDLGRALESARLDLSSGERRFAAAQERHDAELDPGAALGEEVAARRLQLSNTQRVVSLLQEQSERIESAREAAHRLAGLRSGSVEPEALADWQAAAKRAIDSAERALSLRRTRAEELRHELQFQRERREQLSAGSPHVRWVALQTQSLEELLRQYEREVEALEQQLGVERELEQGLAREAEHQPLSARLRALLHRVGEIWSYAIAGSEAEPITLGMLASALAIFLIGYFMASLVSRGLGRALFPRLRLDEGAAHAFESLGFYLLLLVAFLTALRMVQIPLTAFAVLGGALAIGVGFGSQNVVNNFISGLILLAERPIKPGDLIEVEGVYGTVERIGLRSTRVRTGDNVHIIVPNASFLESKVINWTHTDPRVRIAINVGIEYGSPTREAERLIRQALDEAPLVLKSPEPIVLFLDFGDDALLFETRFWIEMRTVLDRLRIESELRFRIDDLFRAAGITIAFPQRDVHLDTSSPLEVRMLPTEGA